MSRLRGIFGKSKNARFLKDPIWKGSTGGGGGGGIEVTINVQRSAAQLAGDGVWFTCDVSNMTRGAGAGTYDPRLHKLHYFWEFYVGDSTPRTFGDFLNIPAIWNNKRVSYLPKPSHIYDEPGTYTVGVTVVDEETGEIGTGEATVVVADPDTYYTAAQTIVVASDSDYTGAPSHDVGNRYTTIQAGLSAMQALAGEGRMVVKTGTSYTVNSLSGFYAGPNFANFRIETWGTAAKPVLDMGTNNQKLRTQDFDGKDITIRGLRMVGGWNPQTESGNRNAAIEFFSGPNCKYSLSNMEIVDAQAGVVILGAASSYNQNSRYCLSSIHIDGWQSYGLYFDAEHSAGSSTDANVHIGVNGCTIAHDPLALAGGAGDFSQPYNSQECFRQVNWAKVAFDACDFFSKGGWFVANDKPAVGACIRGNASEKDGQELYVSRTVMESGTNILSIGPSEGNYLIDTCLMVGSIDTTNIFEMMGGGTTIRNVMAVRPDSVTHSGNGFAFFSKNGTITAADGAEGLNLYSNTFVNLQSFGTWNFDNFGYLATDYSVLVNTNNFRYGPNLGTPYSPDGAATGAKIAGFTPRYSGWRWGFEYFSFTVPSTANGATFDILYSAITLQEGGNPTSSTFGSGRNMVGNWLDGVDVAFSFLSDRVRITNNTGGTISGSYKIRLDRHNGTLPAQNTAKATPSNLAVLWEPTGAALDAAVSQPIAIRDVTLITRPSPADEGAYEVVSPAVERGLIFTDVFTGSDGTDVDAGGYWELVDRSGSGATAKINTNKLRITSTTGAWYQIWKTKGSWDPDQWASMTYEGRSGTSQVIAAAAVRVSGGTGTGNYYAAYMDPVNNTVRLYKRVSGTETALNAAVAHTWVAGDELRIEVQGEAIRAYINGSLVTTASDGQLADGKPGIYGYITVVGEFIEVDNFKAGVFAFVSDGLLPAWAQYDTPSSTHAYTNGSWVTVQWPTGTQGGPKDFLTGADAHGFIIPSGVTHVRFWAGVICSQGAAEQILAVRKSDGTMILGYSALQTSEQWRQCFVSDVIPVSSGDKYGLYIYDRGVSGGTMHNLTDPQCSYFRIEDCTNTYAAAS